MSASSRRLNEVSTMVVYIDQNDRRTQDITELSFKWAEWEFLSLASKAALIPFNPKEIVVVAVRGLTDDNVIVLRRFDIDEIEKYRASLSDGITYIKELDG